MSHTITNKHRKWYAISLTEDGSRCDFDPPRQKSALIEFRRAQNQHIPVCFGRFHAPGGHDSLIFRSQHTTDCPAGTLMSGLIILNFFFIVITRKVSAFVMTNNSRWRYFSLAFLCTQNSIASRHVGQSQLGELRFAECRRSKHLLRSTPFRSFSL